MMLPDMGPFLGDSDSVHRIPSPARACTRPEDYRDPIDACPLNTMCLFGDIPRTSGTPSRTQRKGTGFNSRLGLRHRQLKSVSDAFRSICSRKIFNGTKK